MPNAPYVLNGRVAVITLDNPPVNGMGLAVRQAVVGALDAAAADPAVAAVVITGNDRFFSGGADVREFGTPLFQAQVHAGELDGLCLFARDRVHPRVGIFEVREGVVHPRERPALNRVVFCGP